VLGRNSTPRVARHDHHFIRITTLHRKLDAPVALRSIDRIADQVVEHLPQLTGMNGDFAFGYVIALYLNSSGQQLRVKHRARVFQDRRQPCHHRQLAFAMRRQRLLGKL
jgi:hypothetical protein